jgi:subtilisin-like proprotein convertase family protein
MRLFNLFLIYNSEGSHHLPRKTNPPGMAECIVRFRPISAGGLLGWCAGLPPKEDAPVNPFRFRKRPPTRPRRPALSSRLELLEDRTLPSASNLTGIVAQTFHNIVAEYGPGQSPGGYWPSQIRQAYGFNQLSLDGTGQTIAIVDAYSDPNLSSDLAAFDSQFSLSAPPSFLQVSQTGGPSSSVPTDSTGGWEVEEALDVEWAHAIAPKANILLVEANSANLSDLLSAVSYAASQTNVVAVSMSWGGNEFSGQSNFDSYFTTPAGHKGITFVAASGDNGAPAGWPASSPNVLAVGGTSLSLSASDTRVSEPGWSGSGGGYSAVYSTPSYQQTYAQSAYVQNTLNNSVLLAGSRGNPDVSYNANPSPGFAVYDSFPYYGNSYTWFSVGGTSAGSPQWAALIALADQQRGALGSLDGRSQTLPDLYKLAASSTTYTRDFFDVTSGSNGYSAQPGYDLVTGLGSPQANNLIPDLAGNAASSVYFTVSAPASATAGAPFSVTVTAHNPDGTVDTGYAGTVQFTSSDAQAVLPPNTSFAGDNGVLTIGGLPNAFIDLKTAGTQTITVTDTSSASITGTASVSVTAAQASTLTLAGFPSPVYAGTPGTFTVTARDAYGNIATGDNNALTFSSSDPNPSLPTSGTLHNGTGSFTATLNTPGTQSLTVTDTAAGLSASQTGIVVNPAPSTLTFTSSDVPAPILSGYATVSYLNVPSNVTLANLTVKLSITYPRDGNLLVALVSPSGVATYLSYFEGGRGANFQGTVFDSTAATPISSGRAPFAGTYRPDSSLFVYNGKNAQGTWQLWVEDYGYSSGKLTSWSLTITPSSAAPTGPAFAPHTAGLNSGEQVPGVILEPLAGATAAPSGVPASVGFASQPAQGAATADLGLVQASLAGTRSGPGVTTPSGVSGGASVVSPAGAGSVLAVQASLPPGNRPGSGDGGVGVTLPGEEEVTFEEELSLPAESDLPLQTDVTSTVAPKTPVEESALPPTVDLGSVERPLSVWDEYWMAFAEQSQAPLPGLASAEESYSVFGPAAVAAFALVLGSDRSTLRGDAPLRRLGRPFDF